MVMLYHFWYELPTDPLHSVWARVIRTGWAGVDVFFVLSGFLITGILLDSKGEAGYFRTFYIRRALRIFPLYYFVLALRFLLLPWLFPDYAPLAFTGSQAAWSLSYLNNVGITLPAPVATGTAHFWSLAVEEQFYLIWPAVVLACSVRQLERVIGWMIVVALAARVAAELLVPDRSAAYFLTPMRMDALAIGAYLAIVARREGGPLSLRRYVRPAAIACGALLVVIAAAHRGTLSEHTFEMSTVGYLVVDVAAAALLITAVTDAPETRLRRALESPVAQRLGRYSYGLYVYHWALFELSRPFVRSERIPTILGSRLPAQLACTALMFALSLAIAAASYHFFERPFLQLKDRFKTTTRPEPTPEPTPELATADAS